MDKDRVARSERELSGRVLPEPDSDREVRQNLPIPGGRRRGQGPVSVDGLVTDGFSFRRERWSPPVPSWGLTVVISGLLADRPCPMIPRSGGVSKHSGRLPGSSRRGRSGLAQVGEKAGGGENVRKSGRGRSAPEGRKRPGRLRAGLFSLQETSGKNRSSVSARDSASRRSRFPTGIQADRTSLRRLG